MISRSTSGAAARNIAHAFARFAGFALFVASGQGCELVVNDGTRVVAASDGAVSEVDAAGIVGADASSPDSGAQPDMGDAGHDTGTSNLDAAPPPPPSDAGCGVACFDAAPSCAAICAQALADCSAACSNDGCTRKCQQMAMMCTSQCGDF